MKKVKVAMEEKEVFWLLLLSLLLCFLYWLFSLLHMLLKLNNLWNNLLNSNLETPILKFNSNKFQIETYKIHKYDDS